MFVFFTQYETYLSKGIFFGTVFSFGSNGEYCYFRIDSLFVFFFMFFCLEIRLRISHKVFDF